MVSRSGCSVDRPPSVEGSYGGVSERFKELVLKTSDTATYQGFESLPLRQLLFTAVGMFRVLFKYLFYFTVEKYSSGEEAPLLRE